MRKQRNCAREKEEKDVLGDQTGCSHKLNPTSAGLVLLLTLANKHHVGTHYSVAHFIFCEREKRLMLIERPANVSILEPLYFYF